MTDRELKHLINTLLATAIANIGGDMGMLTADEAIRVEILLESTIQMINCDRNITNKTRKMVLQVIKEAYDYINERLNYHE